MTSFAEDFAAGLEIAEQLQADGFDRPLREQWIAACASDLMTAIEQRLAELPPGWRLAVSYGEIERGDQPGSWQLRHRFIAIDPACPEELPIPASAGRWTLYGPARRADNAV